MAANHKIISIISIITIDIILKLSKLHMFASVSTNGVLISISAKKHNANL